MGKSGPGGGHFKESMKKIILTAVLAALLSSCGYYNTFYNARKYYNDYTALHFAVKYKKNDVVAYLIDQGSELNPVDSKGKTPLDYCKSNNEDLMTLLIDAGAKSASEL